MTSVWEVTWQVYDMGPNQTRVWRIFASEEKAYAFKEQLLTAYKTLMFKAAEDRVHIKKLLIEG